MTITRMLELKELDPSVREAALKWQALGGDVNMYRVFGQMPDFFTKFLEFSAHSSITGVCPCESRSWPGSGSPTSMRATTDRPRATPWQGG